MQAKATTFGNDNSSGYLACGLLLLCLVSGACSGSKHVGQSLVIDDFERSALNAMTLRLPVPAARPAQLPVAG